MSESLHQALGSAVTCLLRPVVRLLLRHGMAYGTFAELARKVYVEEGFERLATTGKRPSVSGVSALTGLTRKETKRLRELELVDESASSQRYNRATRVISGWTTDPGFLTGAGAPAVLPLEGEERSFSALVRAYSGDIPPAAMLSVLEASDTVTVDDHGVTLQSRAYIPSATPVEKIEILGTDVAQLITTIDHNLSAEQPDRFFQRKVSNVLVHPDALVAFRNISNHKSQQLLEEYHEWLRNHQVSRDDDSDVTPRTVAVGIYYSEDARPSEE